MLSSAPYLSLNSGEPPNASDTSTRLEMFRLQRSTQNASPAASGCRKKYAKYKRVTDAVGSVTHGAWITVTATARDGDAALPCGRSSHATPSWSRSSPG